VLESNGQLPFLQRDQWLRQWHDQLVGVSVLRDSATLRLALFVIAPVALLVFIVVQLRSHEYGLLLFVVDLLVLLYSFGRGDLKAQMATLDADIARDDLQAAFHDAAVFNLGHRASSAVTSDALFDELTRSLPYRIFERTFAPVFLFFFFGAPAALAYRLLALHGDMELDQDPAETTKKTLGVGSSGDMELDQEPAETADPAPNTANKILWFFEWLPARALACTLGLMGNFSHTATRLQEQLFSTETSTADLLQQCFYGALGGVENVSDSDLVPQMRALFTRGIMAWLVVIAILVLVS
tara:strand:+ start:6131 stop:7024 length:894 start_codon:yes stop_codon:yes gene_type:complete